METVPATFFAVLRQSGMPEVPEQFSVALAHQAIPSAILADIDAFIRTFDRVTTRPVWQDVVTASAPEIAPSKRNEVCFFSAWDFHLPPEQPTAWQLIECNDNGSGFVFAALINRFFYESFPPRERFPVQVPPPFPALADRVASMVEREALEFFGEFPAHLFLILDDRESLTRGRFRHELMRLRDVLRQRGWPAEIGAVEEVHWNGKQLLWNEKEVSFVINRATDFFWRAPVFSPLRAAYEAGRTYIAPNPFTYATRSDKRLLEFLSHPDWDAQLGIEGPERALLSAHVPETVLLREDNLDDLVRRKADLVFKPAHGFASHGLLVSSQVGRTRLRRLLRKTEGYVAQRCVPKSRLLAPGTADVFLWADLRVWAYRGERFLLSGRASVRPDILDLTPPGGWLATYAGKLVPKGESVGTQPPVGRSTAHIRASIPRAARSASAVRTSSKRGRCNAGRRQRARLLPHGEVFASLWKRPRISVAPLSLDGDHECWTTAATPAASALYAASGERGHEHTYPVCVGWNCCCSVHLSITQHRSSFRRLRREGDSRTRRLGEGCGRAGPHQRRRDVF